MEPKFKNREEYEKWKAEKQELNRESKKQQEFNSSEKSTQKDSPDIASRIKNKLENMKEEIKPHAKEFVGSAQQSTKEFANTAKASSKDALEAFLIFAKNPVGGILEAFEGLGSKRAMSAGIFFAIIFDLCVIIGMYLILRKISGMFGAFASPKNSVGGGGGTSLWQLLKFLITGFVPLVSITIASTLSRKIFRGEGSMEGDIFIAGAALLPLGALILLLGLLGWGNIEIIAIIGIIALCYTILILYSGCTKISKISDSASALAISAMLILSIWVTKIIFTSMS